MRDLVGRVIELAMSHASACGHALHLAGRQCFDVTHVVLMSQLPLQDIADDFHVAVTVGSKAGTGLNAVFIDDAKRTETHVLRVVVVGE